jgi:hypothetical protein
MTILKKPSNKRQQKLVFSARADLFIKDIDNETIDKIKLYKEITELLKTSKPIDIFCSRNLLCMLKGGFFIEIDPKLWAVCESITGNLELIGEVLYSNDICINSIECEAPVLYQLSTQSLMQIKEHLLSNKAV